MDPLAIFITAMILITPMSLFHILTARPSNVGFNTHSGDSKRHLPERRPSSSNVSAEEGHEWAPDGAFLARPPTVTHTPERSGRLLMVVSWREDKVRAMFHAYNNGADVDALVEGLTANRDLLV
jgi:hypothetical protein